MNIPPPDWTPTNSEYHATEGRWSNSRLRLFRECPQEAFRVHVQGKPPTGQKQSVAMALGSALSQFVTDPALPGVGTIRAEAKSRHAKAFKTAQEAYPDRIVLTEPEHDRVLGMENAILHPQTQQAEVARALLTTAPGYTEYCHRWLDPTGVPCMIKVDRLVWLDGRVVSVELKSTRDASPHRFAWAARDLGYDKQAGLYRRGLRDKLKMDTECYYIAVHSFYPFEVAVYPADEELYLKPGEDAVVEELSRLAECLQDPTGRSWHQPWELSDALVPLRLPARGFQGGAAATYEEGESEEEGT